MARGNGSLVVLAGIAVVFLLYFGAPFFVPLFVSLLISYALAPLVTALAVVVRWRVLAAGMVVLGLIALGGLAAWSWSDDVQRLWEEAPVTAKTLSRSLQKYVRPAGPLNEVKKAAAELESVAQTGNRTPAPAAAPAAPAASQMTLLDLVKKGGKGIVTALVQLAVVLFLVFFMLASGDLFKRKLLAIAAERNKKRFTLQVLEEIDSHIRNYLMVLVIANVLVGLGTWLVFWLFDMKYPALWGTVAGVVHTVPYFGPALIAVGSLLAAFMQFESWGRAALVAGASILVAALVGQLFATWLASKQTSMNTTAVFIGLLFFGWIWGVWGLLLAIPLLAIVKTVCEANEDWKPVAELLGR